MLEPKLTVLRLKPHARHLFLGDKIGLEYRLERKLGLEPRARHLSLAGNLGLEHLVKP